MKRHKLCTGKYLAVIASDDIYYLPHALEKLVNTLESDSDCVLAVGNNSLMDERVEKCYWDNKHKQNVYPETDAKFLTFADYLENSCADVDFNSNDFGNYISLLKWNYIPNGYLFNRELFISFGRYDETVLIEDHKLMLNMSKLGEIKYVNEISFTHRGHDTNTTKSLIKNHY